MNSVKTSRSPRVSQATAREARVTKSKRPRKYATEAERVRARKEAAERWYRNNKVYSERTVRRWTELDHILKTGLKFCPGCELELPADDEHFYTREVSLDGFSTYCRDCQSERASENYQQNKELKKAVRDSAHKRSL